MFLAYFGQNLQKIKSNKIFEKGGKMKTKSKSLKFAFTLVIAMFTVLLSGFVLTACGGNKQPEAPSETTARSTYVFETTMPSNLTVGETYNFDVTLKADKVGNEGYEHVRILLEIDNSENLEIVAVTDEGHEIDVGLIGAWGPESGFALTPDYNETTSVKLRIKTAGTFTVTMKLVDLDNNNAVIIEDTDTYVVSNATAQ